MKNETVTLSREFKRENRYVVIKVSKCTTVQMRRLDEALDKLASACVDCVVVEKDWPEYEPVWQMIERRMNDAALADPVPPAGGEPEVLGYGVKGNRYMIRRTKGELLEMSENYAGDVLIELVDRAHVTRLQAEVVRSNAAHDAAAQHQLNLNTEIFKLQSDLTKARELFQAILNDPRLVVAMPSDLLVPIKLVLSRQLSPADKGRGDAVAEIVSKFGDPEAFGERELIALKDISKFPYGTKLYTNQSAPASKDGE